MNEKPCPLHQVLEPGEDKEESDRQGQKQPLEDERVIEEAASPEEEQHCRRHADGDESRNDEVHEAGA